MTASPVVINDTVYAGSFDGTFYAVNATTGKRRWTFKLTTTPSIDFGRIVSTASVAPVADPKAPGRSRLVVMFGGDSSLWALDAITGRELTHIDLDPRDAAKKAADNAAGNHPTVEVMSSPVVGNVRVGNRSEQRIYVGFDVHNQRAVGRSGVVALRLLANQAGHFAFVPLWKVDPETRNVYHGAAGLTAGSGQGFGCGGVWSSPALDLADGLVVFGTASCSHPEDAIAAGENFAEEMVAARADTGQIAWSFRPGKTAADAHLDYDFGASANVFTTQSGVTLVGEGRKDACYYARYAKTGAEAWHTCSGQPGYVNPDLAIGGFLGTPAVQTDSRGRAVRIIGATAIPVPHSGTDAGKSTIIVRAMNPATGAVLWRYRLAGPTYSSVAVAGGVVFVPDTFTSAVIALDARFGTPVASLPVFGPPSSTPAIVGDSVYVTSGTGEPGLPLGQLSGIQRFTLVALPTG
jgi:polyvinyl alcohol dehydrogenase (cytochrome)